MSVLSDGLARYLSPAQLAALSATRVGIVGAGGLGSNVALMLVRSGLRQLVIADHDVVEPSNLNRQAFWPEDLGLPKVEALAARLRALEPALDLTLHQTTVTAETASTLFAACPIVVEAVDGAGTKAMLYAVFAPVKRLLVTASGLAGYGGPPLEIRRPRSNVVAVGDFTTPIGPGCPPLAPRVTQAAAMQADAVLECILATAT